MVLFQEDIRRDNVYIDTSTKNVSFLRMAINLNKMGIKNNTFFLSLYDRELIGRDPHNLNDPSLELRERIAMESKVNFWYFIREVVRIASSGSDGVPYRLTRASLAQAWIFFNSIKGFLTMPRQNGKTIGMCTIACWYLIIAGYRVKWGMFCNGSMLQWDNVKRFKEIRDNLPPYLYHPSVADSNNKEGVSYSCFDNHLQTFIAQMDKQAADRLGRGATLASESWDEIAYFVNNDLSWNSATAAMNEAAPRAREAGLPATVIITTTAGDIDDKWGANAYSMVQNSIRFTEQFYDCQNHQQLQDIVDTNSKNGVVYMEYSYKQLGRSEEWFKEVTQAKDPKIIAKDYLNQWIHGSDNSLFEKDILDKINGSKKNVVKMSKIENLNIYWYQDPDAILADPILKNKPYIIGCDTSDNVGRDFTTMVMLDPYDLSVVATFRSNASNFVFVAQCLAKLLIDFPRSIIIPERNKAGAQLIDFLLLELQSHRINPLKKIFNRFFQEYDGKTNFDMLNYSLGTVRKEFGFNTTTAATSRPFLYSRVMMTALKLAANRVNDPQLIMELSGLTTRNGRVDHSETGHDDTVISYLLACYFILFAENTKFYGIELGEMLRSIDRTSGNAATEEEKRQRELARNKLADYRRKLKCLGDNVILRSTYQREIMDLEAFLGEEAEETPPDTQIMSKADVAAKATQSARARSPVGDPASWIRYGSLSFVNSDPDYSLSQFV